MLFYRQYLGSTFWPLTLFWVAGWYYHPQWTWVLFPLLIDASAILLAGYSQHFFNATIDDDFEDLIARVERKEAELNEMPWEKVFGMVSPAFQRFFAPDSEAPITILSAFRVRVRVFVYSVFAGNSMPRSELAFMSFLRTAYVVVADNPLSTDLFARFKLFHELAVMSQ